MNIHILSISGTMTTPLALALVKAGHQLSGSDQNKIYPPFSTELEHARIPVNQEINFKKIDLFIIGSSFSKFSRCQSEFEFIQRNRLPYISATEYLAENLIKKNSILIAGSYGKTTITSMVSWILKCAGYKPSYFFGGSSLNRIPPLEFSNSDWSVIEADESINGLDTRAKFLYFPVKYLVLTSADWEHKESYPTAADNFNAFRTLIARLPPDGLLIYNPNSVSASKLAQLSPAPSFAYDHRLQLDHQLLGLYNNDNAVAAATLCLHLGLRLSTIQKALHSYRGIKRRLEIISSSPLIIDDFAQSPDRILQSLKTISQIYPHKKIKVFFEPHALFLDNPQSLTGFNAAFAPASEVVISRLTRNPRVKNHVSFGDYQKEIGPKTIYLPLYPDILKHFRRTLKNNDVLVHFSSGGSEGLKLLKLLKRSILK